MPQQSDQKGSWLWNVRNILSILAVTTALSNPVSAGPTTTPDRDDYLKRAERILTFTPLIDGHNDLPNFIRKSTRNQIYNGKLPFEERLSGHTDLPRLRKGKVGGQFWSVYTSCPVPAVPIDDPTVCICFG